MDEPEPVPTERVAPAISSPLLHARDVDPVPALELEPEQGGEFELPQALAMNPTKVVAVGAAAAGAGASALTGDPRIGLALIGVVGLASLLRSADRRLPFSFGEGFVGYRADLGWPRGVQEDDDVHWAWRAPRQLNRR